MALETNAELLGRVPIFHGLHPGQLDAIVRNGREVYFDEGTPILQAGNIGKAAHLVLAGFALPEASYVERFASGILGYGTLLGELAMLVDTQFTLTITAETLVRALAFDRRTMVALMENDPAIARHFSEKLTMRLKLLAADLRRVDSDFAALQHTLDHAIARAV